MKQNIFLIYFCCNLLMSQLFAVTPSVSNKGGFQLLDKICVIVEGERPVLLSEIKKRQDSMGISFIESQNELVRQRLLWIYAKKQLKYDIKAIYKATDEHIEKVMASNKLNKDKFSKILMQPPYLTTFKQFRDDTATAILESNVRQAISSQISVNDEQVQEEVARLKADSSQVFDIVFISITTKKSTRLNNGPDSLNPEFKKANDIRLKLTPTSTLNDIKKLYGDNSNISIIGPIAYEKGALKKAYEDRLKSNPANMVIGPFADDGSVTIMWKIKRLHQKLDRTGLEKVRKELYDRKVMEKFKAITDTLMDSSTVIMKGCSEQSKL